MRSHEKLLVGLAGVLGANELGPMGIRGFWEVVQGGDDVYQGLDVVDANTALVLMILANIGMLFLPDRKSK